MKLFLIKSTFSQPRIPDVNDPDDELYIPDDSDTESETSDSDYEDDDGDYSGLDDVLIIDDGDDLSDLLQLNTKSLISYHAHFFLCEQVESMPDDDSMITI